MKVKFLTHIGVIAICALMGCASKKVDQPNDVNTNNPLLAQVQADLANEAERKKRFIPLDEQINSTKSQNDSCSKFYLAQRYNAGTATDTNQNCREAINWATQSASLNIKKHPLNDPMDVGCAQASAQLLTEIYGSSDGKCKDNIKLAQSKLVLSKITNERTLYEKRRTEAEKNYAANQRQVNDTEARLQQKKNLEQRKSFVRSLTSGADVCMKYRGTTQLPSKYLHLGQQVYGEPIPTNWLILANFEEHNAKISKSKVLVAKIKAYLSGGVDSIESLNHTKTVFKVGNSVWVDDEDLLPCN